MNFGKMADNPRKLENTINYATAGNPEPASFKITANYSLNLCFANKSLRSSANPAIIH